MKTIRGLAALLSMLFAGHLTAQTDENAVAKVGDPMPVFTVQMSDGSTIRSNDLAGKVVLVNFWATWCPPCRAEFKRIPQELVEAFKGQDFVLLAISREEPMDKVTAFMQENGYTFPVGIDPDRSIYGRFALNSIPRNYLIDKSGKIVRAEVGYTPESFEELPTAIRTELAR
ncbi:MAG: TlpA family protein disulfide reductase [Rikenellaceae bacterium]|nr:TlpA family protein disulfide reductase [Rikenellaceae bacterium]